MFGRSTHNRPARSRVQHRTRGSAARAPIHNLKPGSAVTSGQQAFACSFKRGRAAGTSGRRARDAARASRQARRPRSNRPRCADRTSDEIEQLVHQPPCRPARGARAGSTWDRQRRRAAPQYAIRLELIAASAAVAARSPMLSARAASLSPASAGCTSAHVSCPRTCPAADKDRPFRISSPATATTAKLPNTDRHITIPPPAMIRSTASPAAGWSSMAPTPGGERTNHRPLLRPQARGRRHQPQPRFPPARARPPAVRGAATSISGASSRSRNRRAPNSVDVRFSSPNMPTGGL